MKFELLNAQDQVIVSADVQGDWMHDGPVTYLGDTSLLEWHKSPAPGAMLECFFQRAAHEHGLRYSCDTFHIRPH